MKTMWIGVNRNTIEEHEEDSNIAFVLVTKDFVKQYFNDCQKEYYDSMEDFLNEYITDDTEDFYDYAVEHNAVLDWEVW